MSLEDWSVGVQRHVSKQHPQQRQLQLAKSKKLTRQPGPSPNKPLNDKKAVFYGSLRLAPLRLGAVKPLRIAMHIIRYFHASTVDTKHSASRCAPTMWNAGEPAPESRLCLGAPCPRLPLPDHCNWSPYRPNAIIEASLCAPFFSAPQTSSSSYRLS